MRKALGLSPWATKRVEFMVAVTGTLAAFALVIIVILMT